MFDNQCFEDNQKEIKSNVKNVYRPLPIIKRVNLSCVLNSKENTKRTNLESVQFI